LCVFRAPLQLIKELEDNNLNKSSRFLRSFRKKVLLIDADPQANASSGLGIDVDNVEIGTYQILEHSNTPAGQL
jgi:cellulose biosynthesis protein BcsQ